MKIDGVEVGRRGILLIVSGPSGAGKTSLSDRALAELSGIELSVSMTTRPARQGEVDGMNYRFVEESEFRSMIATGALAEWAEVHGNLYGTPAGPLREALEDGRDLLLDIDVQGAMHIKASYPEAVAIFLLPPDRRVLEQRLSGRGTEAPEVLKRRLENACREISFLPSYDYAIVNEELAVAFQQFESILRAERSRLNLISEGDLDRIVRAFGGRC